MQMNIEYIQPGLSQDVGVVDHCCCCFSHVTFVLVEEKHLLDGCFSSRPRRLFQPLLCLSAACTPLCLCALTECADCLQATGSLLWVQIVHLAVISDP